MISYIKNIKLYLFIIISIFIYTTILAHEIKPSIADFTYDEILKGTPISGLGDFVDNNPSYRLFNKREVGFYPSTIFTNEFHKFQVSDIEEDTLGLKDDNYKPLKVNSQISFSSGSTFSFGGNKYSTIYVNKGNITFDANDTTTINTVTDHLSKSRITAYGGDNHTLMSYYLDNKNTRYDELDPSLTLTYTNKLVIDFYNKFHFIKYIFNHIDNTFERTDGENHGYSTGGPPINFFIENQTIDKDLGFFLVLSCCSGYTILIYKYKI